MESQGKVEKCQGKVSEKSGNSVSKILHTDCNVWNHILAESGSGLSGGAIAGIVIGCLSIVCSICGCIFKYCCNDDEENGSKYPDEQHQMTTCKEEAA